MSEHAMPEHVRTSREGSRLDIVIDRPAKKNALTVAMYEALSDALARAEEDDGILSVVIASEGGVFSAGNDLQDFMAQPPLGPDAPVMRFLAALAGCTKVVCAAIQGPAVGVGATMLLHCDHVAAARSASIQFSFVKMALVPEAGSSLLLPRFVGPLKAAELMLTGDAVPAEEAERLGLVSRVVADGEERAAARAFAARLDGQAPKALRETKRLMRSETMGMADRMAEEGAVFAAQLRGPEFKEAVTAFLAKRAPDFASS